MLGFEDLCCSLDVNLICNTIFSKCHRKIFFMHLPSMWRCFYLLKYFLFQCEETVNNYASALFELIATELVSKLSLDI